MFTTAFTLLEVQAFSRINQITSFILTYCWTGNFYKLSCLIIFGKLYGIIFTVKRCNWHQCILKFNFFSVLIIKCKFIFNKNWGIFFIFSRICRCKHSKCRICKYTQPRLTVFKSWITCYSIFKYYFGNLFTVVISLFKICICSCYALPFL